MVSTPMGEEWRPPASEWGVLRSVAAALKKSDNQVLLPEARHEPDCSGGHGSGTR
jgi:hypothetical protein